MRTWTSHQLRQSFIDFFRDRGHEVVPSSSVIPADDPTLLFTNAGMNQFKDLLLGNETRSYKRAVSVQKCLRAGGKHNDLEHVGRDGRHNTFFEMLGNWSFGDYFKKEAIRWAWQFLTEVLNLDILRLYATVDAADAESFALWKNDIKISPSRLVTLGNFRQGKEDNFWSMGPTGPCGFCTELYYDNGFEKSCGRADCFVGCDCDRYMEIWNLVFMEYSRDETGSMSPLPIKSVDTGLGIERVTTILQNKNSVYQSDIFADIIAGIEKETNQKYTPETKISMHVIADHLRAVSFALADGAVFSNEGRGYVIRRILRRAIRHGRLLGMQEPFIYRLTDIVSTALGPVYPEIAERQKLVAASIQEEEEKFLRTLDRGIALFEAHKNELQQRNSSVISGDFAFRLYDTYGFPLDLTEILADEAKLTIDTEAFNQALSRQKSKSQKAAKFYASQKGEDWQWIAIDSSGSESIFVGYQTLSTESKVLRYARLPEENRESLAVLLNSTPFYAESGGQVGDCGRIYNKEIELAVVDTQKWEGKNLHICQVRTGSLDGLQLPVNAEVDSKMRLSTMRNHTATHLLHHVLRLVVGTHVMQSGSHVNGDRLRFDFNSPHALSGAQIFAIENAVNELILQNIEVKTVADLSVGEAKARGAMALFGEKYLERVRMVDIGQQSIELCGGTHVGSTSELGLFKIVSESSLAAGVRRIEAITGLGLISHFQKTDGILQTISKEFGVGPSGLLDFISKQEKELKQLKQELQKAKSAKTIDLAPIIDAAEKVGPVSFIFHEVKVLDKAELLNAMDRVIESAPLAVVLLHTQVAQNRMLALGVSKAANAQHGFDAGKLMKELSSALPLSGGGKELLAQGSLKDPGQLELLKDRLRGLVESQVKNI